MVEWNTPTQRFLQNPVQGHYDRYKLKIGKIFQLMTTPCNNDQFWAFVLAPFFELPTMLYTLLQHECKDAVWDRTRREWVKHGRGDGPGHGRRGIAGFQAQGYIRGTVPPTAGMNWSIVKVGDVLQKIGAYFLIVDAALNWDINWLSTALKWSGCPPTPDCWSAGTLIGPVYGNHCSTITMDMAATFGSNNLGTGLSGFSTQVPITTINVTGVANMVPFGAAEFTACTGGHWLVNTVSSPSEALLVIGTKFDSQSSNAGAQTSQAGQAFTAFPKRMSGNFQLEDPCTPNKGGKFDESPYYIHGDLTTSVQGMWGKDPCQGGIGVGIPIKTF